MVSRDFLCSAAILLISLSVCSESARMESLRLVSLVRRLTWRSPAPILGWTTGTPLSSAEREDRPPYRTTTEGAGRNSALLSAVDDLASLLAELSGKDNGCGNRGAGGCGSGVEGREAGLDGSGAGVENLIGESGSGSGKFVEAASRLACGGEEGPFSKAVIDSSPRLDAEG